MSKREWPPYGDVQQRRDRIAVLTAERDRYREALDKFEPWMVRALRGEISYPEPIYETADHAHIASVIQGGMDTLPASEEE